MRSVGGARERPTTAAWLTAVVVAATSSAILCPQSSRAQSCSWGGTSLVEAPSATYLRDVDQRLRAPTRLAVGEGGGLLTVDASEHRILVQDAYGRDAAPVAPLAHPTAIAVDPFGNSFVADAEDGSVSVFDPSWRFLFSLGQGGGEFVSVSDLAVDWDPSQDAVYVADGGADLVKVYRLNGAFAFAFGGSGTAAGQLDFPSAIHVSAAGEILVGDQNNDRVQVFDRQGAFLRCFGSRNGPSSFQRRFGRISGITTDALGRIYVADAFQGEVAVFDAAGVKLGTIGSFGEGPGALRTPIGVALDPFQRLWVASANNGRLSVFGIDDFRDPIGPSLPVALASVRPAELALPFGSKVKKLEISLSLVGRDVRDIAPWTVTVNGVALREWHKGKWKLEDDDGAPVFEIKLDPREVFRGLGPGPAALTVAGQLQDGAEFVAEQSVELVPRGEDGSDSDEDSDEDSDKKRNHG